MFGLLAFSTAENPNASARTGFDNAPTRLADLEKEHRGRLGDCILHVTSGYRLEHRANERFAMCSTFKVLAVALVLTRVDNKQENLDRRIVYSKESVVSYSPETQKHAGEDGMTLGEICKAALTLSDNTAANLILESIGGPLAVTRFARSLGDSMTRLDRTETTLNEAKTGDPRDTTTPASMAENLRKIVLGDVLSSQSRNQMKVWMVANKSGDKRIRAGIPKGRRVGDKMGIGGNGSTNDIAVLWRPSNRGPLIMTVYFAESPASVDARNGVIAQAGRLAVLVRRCLPNHLETLHNV